MIGNMAVYAALTQPGDTVMTIPQPVGGHSSNRHDGPAGIRGLNIVDVPFDPHELEVDLDAFAREAQAGAAEADRARRVDDALPAPGAARSRASRRSGAGRSSSTARTSSG